MGDTNLLMVIVDFSILIKFFVCPWFNCFIWRRWIFYSFRFTVAVGSVCLSGQSVCSPTSKGLFSFYECNPRRCREGWGIRFLSLIIRGVQCITSSGRHCPVCLQGVVNDKFIVQHVVTKLLVFNLSRYSTLMGSQIILRQLKWCLYIFAYSSSPFYFAV